MKDKETMFISNLLSMTTRNGHWQSPSAGARSADRLAQGLFQSSRTPDRSISGMYLPLIPWSHCKESFSVKATTASRIQCATRQTKKAHCPPSLAPHFAYAPLGIS